jgi:hypothetical protein
MGVSVIIINRIKLIKQGDVVVMTLRDVWMKAQETMEEILGKRRSKELDECMIAGNISECLRITRAQIIEEKLATTLFWEMANVVKELIKLS